MKKLLLAVLFLCSSVAAEETPAQPSLTIYNQNFVVVRERLPLDLKPGMNHVEFNGITAHLEPDSVLLRDPAGRALQILEQNYRNDPISQELLLSRYVGKTIDFIVQQNGSKIETIKGKIIRSGYIPSSAYNQGYQTPGMGQPIIEVDGILRFGLPGQPLFPALDSDSILKPTLNWLLQTNQPGAFDAEISYVSGGMSWQADYNLVIADKNEGRSNFNLVDLVGWVTMHNQSGKTFENARIKLMAGDVNKIANQLALPASRAAMKMADEAAMAPVVREKSFDEFHLYTLERSTTLRDEETKQVEFVRATSVRSQRLYVYDGANFGPYSYYSSEQILQDPGYGTQSNPKVWVMQEFKNSEGNHLGIPLPKGRLRFYRRDTDGHLEFIGENTIDHTPKDETIRVYTGNAFDVTGERKRTNFRTDSHQHWMDEAFEIRVRNHKKEPVQVRVVEHLYRWTNWKIVENSDDYRKKDAQTVEFPVTLAPDGEQVVTYTVHYSW
ncbi:MAG TPA: DUF4139 domain-containing protein [Terriglobales bacterium]|nr:DUF4139 domain-containing protein [Terriglobales bacterium]